MKSEPSTDYLVLWKYSEALRLEGQVITKGVGTHSGDLRRGDRMFVVASREKELYLLGAIKVQRSGLDWAEGPSLCGAFRRIPLKGLKWRLRFEHTTSSNLSKTSPLAMQVRARRRLSSESARLLLGVLSINSIKLRRVQQKVEVQEGKTKQVLLSKRERSRKLRVQALTVKGTICEICTFDFAKKYGDFARNCVEVHHIDTLAGVGRNGVTNSLDDVLVLCPNCHRAIHQFKNPHDWKGFRKACGFS
jgi:HNH endonuclease